MPDDTLYLYTSLTAGSSHIITATSRIETILKANKIPFKAVDCATDDKARLLWGRRSKGKKIPGLVKFGDVIGDLEQIEEWNEYGELKDELDSVIDIFGDVPISATSAEAQAAAAARASNAERPPSTGPSRSSSETRHISISEPKDKPGSAAGAKKEDSPLSMAMRQAGAEAAAKAGQKKTASPAVSKAAPTSDPTDKSTPAPVEQSKLSQATADPDETNTAAKAPAQLESEGIKKASIHEAESAVTDPDADKVSTEEQVLKLKRKSSVANTPSTLATETTIDEAHTIPDSADDVPTKAATQTRSHRGSEVVDSDAAKIKEIEDANKITEEDEEDEEDDEDDEDEDEPPATTMPTATDRKTEASSKDNSAQG